ncbi:MAG: hypothetical protein U1F43_03125 [Myxococcota bacterium]
MDHRPACASGAPVPSVSPARVAARAGRRWLGPALGLALAACGAGACGDGGTTSDPCPGDACAPPPPTSGLVVEAPAARACDVLLEDADASAAAPEIRFAADVVGVVVREAPLTAVSVTAKDDHALTSLGEVVGATPRVTIVHCYDAAGAAIAAASAHL